MAIRNDSAPGFKALVENNLLANHQITLEIAQPKNRTKNPVAEKAVLEPKQKMLHQGPSGGPVTDLAIAMATLNSWIRKRNLDSKRPVFQQADSTFWLRPHCPAVQAKAN